MSYVYVFRYDEILVTGLPDWRQPVFYYQRVRKMGLLELAVLLTVILTTGHIITLWSIYLERRFEKVWAYHFCCYLIISLVFFVIVILLRNGEIGKTMSFLPSSSPFIHLSHCSFLPLSIIFS